MAYEFSTITRNMVTSSHMSLSAAAQIAECLLLARYIFRRKTIPQRVFKNSIRRAATLLPTRYGSGIAETISREQRNSLQSRKLPDTTATHISQIRDTPWMRNTHTHTHISIHRQWEQTFRKQTYQINNESKTNIQNYNYSFIFFSMYHIAPSLH